MSTQLTPTEKRFLDVLLDNEGQPVTRTELYQQCWSIYFNPGSNRCDVMVRRIRAKNYSIRSHKGIGYSYSPTYEQPHNPSEKQALCV